MCIRDRYNSRPVACNEFQPVNTLGKRTDGTNTEYTKQVALDVKQGIVGNVYVM